MYIHHINNGGDAIKQETGMTNEQIEQFVMNTARWNGGAEATKDDSPVVVSQIVKTHEPIENFTKNAPNSDGLVVHERFQFGKGKTRGTLFIQNFGDFRMIFTTGDN
jgi:hypothetical protein